MSRLSGVVLGLLLVGCGSVPAASPSPSAEASAAVSLDARASPTSSGAAAPRSEGPSPAPTASSEASGALEPPVVGGLAGSVVAGLRLREEPTVAGAYLGTLPTPSISYVVDGPVRADGHDWYQLTGLGIPQGSGCLAPETEPFNCPGWFGWASATAPDGSLWLAATAPECPTWPSGPLTRDFVYGVPSLMYFVCFAGDARSVIGFYPEIPLGAGLGGACGGVDEDIYWLGCNLGYEHIVLNEADGFGGPGLRLAVDPGAVVMPKRGQWIEVTGQYDHSAAQRCGYPPESAAVLACRAQFVVLSARPVPTRDCSP